MCAAHRREGCRPPPEARGLKLTYPSDIRPVETAPVLGYQLVYFGFALGFGEVWREALALEPVEALGAPSGLWIGAEGWFALAAGVVGVWILGVVHG